MKLVINGRLPSLNDYTKACRGNKYAGAAMKQNAELLISCFIRGQCKGHFVDRYKVHFDWYEKDLRRDMDNVIFGHKFILDALVECGVVKGDSRKYLTTISDNIYVDAKNPRIEVTIEAEESML